MFSLTWELLMNACISPLYLKVFIEETDVVLPNITPFKLLDMILTYLHCSVMLPTFFSYIFVK
jgi:hypothetical protein